MSIILYIILIWNRCIHTNTIICTHSHDKCDFETRMITD